MKRSSIALVITLSLLGSMSVAVGPAHADPVCTKTADPVTHPGLQALLTAVGVVGGTDPVACIQSGTYTINASLTPPIAMRIVGIGLTSPVIECATAIYCVDGTSGPDGVSLENLVLHGAQKADVQIGTGASGAIVTGWSLSGIEASGAGQIGIAMNNAADVLVTGASIHGNGSIAFDAATNPTGDFGFRAVRVDGLTLKDSRIFDNPTTLFANIGFAGGAKFNTDTNLVVQHNTFTGNYGGAQLWVDIDAQGFQLLDNTIMSSANAVNGLAPVEGIRVEVSCGGPAGSVITQNVVEGGTTAGIDLYDANHVVVTDNEVTIPKTGSYGIRMYGNVHDVVPGSGCDDAGAYPNQGNVALANTISMEGSGSPLDGVVNDAGGVSSENTWTDNVYTARHCDALQWKWWDGTVEQLTDFAGWQGLGQDVSGVASCASLFPEIDAVTPFQPTWASVGTVVSIHGSGLADVTSVKFNKVAALAFSATDDEIVATVPEGASTGPICVKNALQGWCSVDFTVAPSVSVSSVLPSSGLPGSQVVMIGAAFTGATGVSMGGLPVDTFTVVTDTEIDAVVSADATGGPVCVVMAIQGTVCGETYAVLPPAAPVLTAPKGLFQLSRLVAAWQPSIGASSYDVTASSARHDGEFTTPNEITTTATQVNLPFVRGATTCVVVAASDAVGSTPAPKICTAVPLDDRDLRRSKGWARISSRRFYRGTALASKTRGASLTITGVRTRTVALLVETRPGGGTIEIRFNGKLVRTVSTASRRAHDRTFIRVVSWGSPRRGSISLRVRKAGKGVVIDGLGLAREG